MSNEYLRQSDLLALNTLSPEEDAEMRYAERLADRGGESPVSLQEEIRRAPNQKARDILLAEAAQRGGDYEQAPAPTKRRSSDWRSAARELIGDSEIPDGPSFDEMLKGFKPEAAAAASNRGLGGTIAAGARSTTRAIGAAIDMRQGDSKELAETAAAATADAAGEDHALASLKQEIANRKKALGEDAGWIDTGKALIGAAIDNPRGAGLLLAEQLPNSAAALGAGYAGMKAGAMAGGAVGAVPGAAVGGVVGGVLGLFGANYALEGGNKGIEIAQSGNLTPEGMSQAEQEGLIKAGVITGVDVATMGLGGKIFGTAQRAVDRAGARVLADAGVDAADRTAVAAAIKANPALITAVQEAESGAFKAATTLAQRAVRGGAAISLETLGEGVGEYWGEGLATGKWDKMEALIESFSSLGQSVGEAAFVASRNRVDPTASILNAKDVDAAIAAAHQVISNPIEAAKLDRSINNLDAAVDAEVAARFSAPTLPTPTADTYNPAGATLVATENGIVATPEQMQTAAAQVEQQRLDSMVQDAPLPGMMARATEQAGEIQKRASLAAEIERIEQQRQERIASQAALNVEEGTLTQAEPLQVPAKMPKAPAGARAVAAAAVAAETAQTEITDAGGRFSLPRTHSEAISAAAPHITDAQAILPDQMRDASQSTGTKATKQEGKLIKTVGKLFGKNVVFFTSSNASAADGLVRSSDNKTIYINANSGISPMAVFGHELAHQIRKETPHLWAPMARVIGNSLGSNGFEQAWRDYHNTDQKNIDALDTALGDLSGNEREEALKKFLAETHEDGKRSRADFILEEATSDMTGNRFREPDFWREVFSEVAKEQGRSAVEKLALKIMAAVKRMINAISGRGFNVDEFVDPKQLDAIRSAIKTAVKDYHNYQRDTKGYGYSDTGYRVGGIKSDTESDGGDVLHSPERGSEKADDHKMHITREDRELADKTKLTRAEMLRVKDSAVKFGLPIKMVEMEVRRIKSRFPESSGWAPLTFLRVDPKTMSKKAKEGNRLPSDAIFFEPYGYQFHLDATGKDDSKTHDARVDGIAAKLAGEIMAKYMAAKQGDKTAQVIMRQAAWYQALRGKLRSTFGGFGDFLAQLLGPTSANNPVKPNFKYAVEALKLATSGKWDNMFKEVFAWKTEMESIAKSLDDLIAEYDQKIADVKKAANERWGVKSNKEKTLYVKQQTASIKAEYKPRINAGEDALKEASKYKGTLPVRENGKMFGMASEQIAQILADRWGDKAHGDAPKTKNYYQNIMGRTIEATIDVWAARTLRRIANDVIGNMPRIPPVAETAVAGNVLSDNVTSGSEFGFGQEVFQKAAEDLRNSGIEEFKNSTPDAIQAMVWFIEKETWATRNWTTKIGEEGSIEHEMLLAGYHDRAQVDAWRVAARAGKPNTEVKAYLKKDGSFNEKKYERDVARWEEAKQVGKEMLRQIERYPDRFVAGVTMEIPGDRPTDANMADLAREIEAAADDPKVMAIRAQTSTGEFIGEFERTLDTELVARNGYNPTPLWNKLVEAGDRDGQQAVFLSRVLREDELGAIDPLKHRPGVELYFTKPITLEQAKPLMDMINAAGVHGMTMVTEGRRTPSAMAGEDQGIVGIRMQHIPEFMLGYSYSVVATDAEITASIRAARDTMRRLARKLAKRSDVSTAKQHWYETRVHFYGDLESTRSAGEGSGEGDRGGWSGQPIGEALKSADRFARDRASSLATRRAELLEERRVSRSDSQQASLSRARSDAASDRRDGGRDAEAGRALPEYGQGQEGSVSVVGQHWSKESRQVLSGAYYGTGISGAERPRVMAAKDRRLRSRIYFYVHQNGDQTEVTPEAGVGSARHDIRLNNLYDANDRSDLQQSVSTAEIDGWPVKRGSAEWLNLFESAVIDAGYDGYVSNFGDQRAAVLIGDHVVETGVKFSLARAQTETPEFKRWFGDSKVVDSDGKPLVVYHGTNADFTEFKTTRIGEFGPAIYLTDSPREAGEYGETVKGISFSAPSAHIMPMYVSLKNPYTKGVDAFWREFGGADSDAAGVERAKAAGYDGVIAKRADRYYDNVAHEFVDRGNELTHYVVFDPTQIKSATGNNGQFDPTNPDIRMSRPRFYSQLERAIEGAPEKVFGPAKQVKAWLQSNSAKLGVKADEIQWTGITDWLDMQAGKVAKSDVLNYLQQNGVKVGEVVNGTPSAEFIEANRAYRDALKNDEPDSVTDPLKAKADALRFGQEKYAKYQLPGGENYRELLLTLPVSEEQQRNYKNGLISRSEFNEGKFFSSHWPETANILAHVRFNDRTDADGNRVLFIEEVQSDWGQIGKKDGFNARTADEIDAELSAVTKERSRLLQEAADLPDSEMATFKKMNERIKELSAKATALSEEFQAAAGKPRVPSAPFVTDTKAWAGLAIKRMIAYAVENGYDKVAFVNGEQSADRYDLSKQVKEITLDRLGRGAGKNFKLAVELKEGGWQRFEVDTESDAAEIIGKEPAGKLFADIGNGDQSSISGNGLKVGGEGMKAFYDQIVPQVANDVLKKLGGGKVEQIRFNDFTGKNDNADDALLAELGVSVEGTRPPTQPGFTITPAMREKVSGGMPLFSRPRIIGDSGRQYDQGQRAAFKRTGRVVNDLTIGEKLAELRKDLAKKMFQGIVDQFAPIKELTSKGYMLARLSKGATGAFEAFMHHGKLSIKDGAYDADTSGGVMEKVFYKLGKETSDFLYWVAGNRAERLKMQGKENLFEKVDIDAYKRLSNGTTSFDYTLSNGKTTRDRTLIYKDALAQFNEFNKNVLDMAEQSGLIDGKSRHLWEHEFYVPFYRVMEDEDGAVRGGNIGKGIVRQRAFEKLKGGTDKLGDLLSNTLMNWMHLIDASAKNRAAAETLKAAERLGAARLAVTGEKKTVWFMENGDKVEYKVDDPYLLTAINGLDYAGLRGPMMDILSRTKHWLTMGVTASPFFKVRNLIRDSVQAIATSDLGYNPIGNVIEGYKLTNRQRQEYVSALAGGGLIRFGTMLEGNEAARARQLIKIGSKDEHILDGEGKISQFYDKYLEPAVTAYNEIGNRGEEINRMSLYDQLIKQGKSHAEASLLARDLMDFSMQGSFTTIRFLTQVVPFMNARLQGMYKLGRAAKEDPAKMAVVLGAVTMASLALLAMYGDDDDWKKREDWDRDNYWWFKLGGTAFRIPKPFEIGAIATLAERSAEALFDSEMNGERYRKVTSKLILDQLAMNPVPQLVKPIIDIYANKDSFTGRPIETMGMEKLDPSYRFRQNTSMVARGISSAGNAVTGEHFLSPVQVDSAIRGYFSWLGAFVVGAADIAVRSASNEPTKPAVDYWKTATGGMVSDLDSASSRYVSSMYEQAKELEQAYGTYRSLIKEGKTAEATEYREDNKEKLSKYREVENVKRAEAKLNERIRMIERSNMQADEKRDLINQIRKQQDVVARRVAPGA